jgi:hypothetical protein
MLTDTVEVLARSPSQFRRTLQVRLRLILLPHINGSQAAAVSLRQIGCQTHALTCRLALIEMDDKIP